jgi:GNAT superfamily N-acetyltransferase
MDELLALFDAHRAAAAEGDGAPLERDGPVTRIRYTVSALVLTPSDTGLRGGELDEVIIRQRDAFAALGMPVEWKTYAYDQPADLPERLVAAGYVAEEPETLLVGESAKLSGLAAEVQGVTIRETTFPDDFVAIGRLQSEVWEEDWSWIVDDLRGRADRLGPHGIRILVAEAGDRVVSAAWLVMRDGSPFAGLWGGSTLAQYRGRGIYRALVSRRAAIARAAGYPYLQVDASEMSRPILERLGFRVLTTTTPYVWNPG